MQSDCCCQCGRSLVPDEVGLSRKLVNRGTTRFWCLRCLAAHYEATEDELRRKIEEFRAMGCTLFSPPEK